MNLCPCRTSNEPIRYDACCGRYHAGPLHLLAPDAESLMRSRYSAFVQDRLGYLLDTWHPSTRPATLAPNPPGLRWLGLEIRKSSPEGDAADPRASVEFVARSKLGGRAERLHEKSRFVREDGRWFYVEGDVA